MDAALAKVIGELNKKYGAGTVVQGSDMVELIPRITTGSLALDVALGGGFVANQWNEIVGQESHGKTAVTLKTVAANQLLDPNYTVAWIAAEGYVRSYADMCGVDNDRVHVVNTRIMEEAYESAIKFLDSRAVDMVVIDSLPALVPGEESDKTMADFQMGLGARLTNKFFRKQGNAVKRSLIEEERPVTGIMINQWREKIGVMYGDPRTTPGGNQKNYEYYTRTEVRRDEYLKEKREGIEAPLPIGQTIKARIFKNKSAPAQRVAALDFYFDNAADGSHFAGEYDTLKEVVTLSVIFGVVQRAGRWYKYEGIQFGSKDELTEACRSDSALMSAISNEVLTLASNRVILPVMAEIE
jgi:recombination protein RecA